MSDIPLGAALDEFPCHVFGVFDLEPALIEERIGGAVMVTVKRPPGGPLTMVTVGVSRFPIDEGLPVELAVEVADGQEGAGMIALRIVCDNIAVSRRTPPLETPWRNSEPFLNRTRISAIVATGSRWGAEFDEVTDPGGNLVGYVRTLRLLTDAEAQIVRGRGWPGLVEAAGSLDALLDVTRRDAATPDIRDVPVEPIIVSKLHGEHPPRWVTLSDQMFHSVTGIESPEYMANTDNHEIWSTSAFAGRFPWTAGFLCAALPGQTALFTDDSGRYQIEES